METSCVLIRSTALLWSHAAAHTDPLTLGEKTVPPATAAARDAVDGGGTTKADATERISGQIVS